MDNLATLLDDEQPEVIEQPTETEEVEKVEEKAEVEPEKVEKEEVTEEPTAPEVKEPESKSVPIQALMAEREKRQAAEKQIESFKQQEADKPAPDIFEDQAAYTLNIFKNRLTTTGLMTVLINQSFMLNENSVLKNWPSRLKLLRN